MLSLILTVLLLGLPKDNDGRPGVKIDRELLSFPTERYKSSKEAFFVAQNQKDLETILRFVEDSESKRVQEAQIDFTKQVAFFLFSKYDNKPDVMVTFEEVNRQGPVFLPGNLVMDDVNIYGDFEYIRGARTIPSKCSYWSMCIVSRTNLKQESDKKIWPLTNKTKFQLFKRVLVDELEMNTDPNQVKQENK